MLTKKLNRAVLASLGLLAASPAAFACTGADCAVETQVEVTFDSSYYLSPNAKGIYLQSNTGSRVANVELQDVKLKNDGALDVTGTAVGNIATMTVDSASNVPVRHINQTSTGNQLANVNVDQLATSMPGEVRLEALALGNSFSYTATGTSLTDLSVVQCNVGDGVANVKYNYDPTKLTASATAIGNNITIRGTR